MIPLFETFSSVVNPALAVARQNAPVVVSADPQQCSLQLDPVGQAAFVASCDIAKSTLATLGISYSNTTGEPGTLAQVAVAQGLCPVEVSDLDAAGVVAARADFRMRLQKALAEAAYPVAVAPAQVSLPFLTFLMFAMIVFSTKVYALVPA